MLRFVVRRFALGVFVMWLVTLLVFAIFYLAGGPSTVARTLAGKNAQPQTVALISHRLRLDQPRWYQYWYFLKQLVWHHDLGYSYQNNESVSHILGGAFPITLSLAIGSAVIWIVLGVMTGVVSAVRRGSLLDRSFTTLALFFYSFPTFVLGLLILDIFYYQFTVHGLHWFPGQYPITFPKSPVHFLQVFALPWITLALVSAATYTRLTRSSLLEVLGEDYIRTARSKGLAERRVIYRHGLRSALTPVASQFGIDVGTLLGGAIITETVFGMPGLGFTAVRSIDRQDLPVIIGIVIVATAAVIIANIVVDIFYAVLDPRVRLH
ncbi:MAG TPA: ABC transporter permease [Acidimicrobiales bacterium]|nr:ABC transporter permease [Acidimicrobiales bacterium]